MAKRNYRVIIARDARDDLMRETQYIRRKHSAQRARHVRKGLLDTIDTLDTFPDRHGKQEELSDDERTYRFLPKWAYLIIYRVEQAIKQVRVVSIFNTNRDPDDIEEVRGR